MRSICCANEKLATTTIWVIGSRANNPNSGGSQFFICAADAPHLNGKYTVFGQVIEGLEIIEQIVNLPRDSRDNPNRRIEMKVRIEKRNK